MEGMIAPNSSAWPTCGTKTIVHIKPPQSTITIAYRAHDWGRTASLSRTWPHHHHLHNAGDGPVVIAKVVPASQKTGGGAVSQVITIPLPKQTGQDVLSV